MVFKYDLNQLEEPTLINILVDEFNERGFNTVLRRNMVGWVERPVIEILGGKHPVLLYVGQTTIELGMCGKCNVYDPESFELFMKWVDICADQPGCVDCIMIKREADKRARPVVD
jgi:hypothetical protein